MQPPVISLATRCCSMCSSIPGVSPMGASASSAVSEPRQKRRSFRSAHTELQ